jgi:hypothetical protein
MKLLCVRRWLSFFLIGPGKRLQLFFLLGAQAKAIAHGRLSKKRMAAEHDPCSRYEERLASRQDRTPKMGFWYQYLVATRSTTQEHHENAKERKRELKEARDVRSG